MKKSDIYICGFMYAFSFFFLYLTQSFPLGARHYPHFVIGLLLILTTVRVGQMVRDYRREKTSENDMPRPRKAVWYFPAKISFERPRVLISILRTRFRISFSVCCIVRVRLRC